MASKLVIVESPAKAKTIGKYLGSDFRVLASVGHVRDLPENRLGINIENGFALEYRPNEDRKKALEAIARAAKSAESVYLATDYDREGEAIAWHVTEEAKIPKDKQHRITFTEITKRAVTEAIRHPRGIDLRLVDAQQARRAIDRLVGYPVSQLLWEKIRYGLSAGRVQSPALRLIVQREREIRAFVPVEYWTLEALLATDARETFVATLVQIGDRRIPTKIQRDSEEDLAARIPDEAQARAILTSLAGAAWEVDKVRAKEVRRTPAAPFITSTLQQDSSAKLGFPARRVMALAQRLYELGHITYMRTDSTSMSGEAIAEARQLITSSFGAQYWAGRYKHHDRKVRGAQEAHECIRPTEMARPRRQVEAAIREEAGRDSDALAKLYDLVWKRSVASLMTPALFDQVSVEVTAAIPGDGGNATFRASGSTLRFDGFMRLYLEGREDTDDADRRLPHLVAGQGLQLVDLHPEQHFTQPPPRYTEGSLVKELEERGIGRPSTYASIISTLTEERRDYTRLENKRFFATDTGEVTTDFLLRYFGDHFMDYTFTSDMEQRLDETAEGKLTYRPMVESFYSPLVERIDRAGVVPKEEITTEVTDIRCPECGRGMVVKLGRRGKFLGCSAYPDCRKTLPAPGQEHESPELLEERCPECGSHLQKRRGRYGPFVGCSNYPQCKYIQKKQARSTGVPCPICEREPCSRCEKDGKPGELIERSGKKGRFFGCNHYPACRHTQNEEPGGQTTPSAPAAPEAASIP